MYKKPSIIKSVLLSILIVILAPDSALSCAGNYNPYEALRDAQDDGGECGYHLRGKPLHSEYENARGEKNPDQGSMRYYPRNDDVMSVLVPLLDIFYERLRADFLDRGFQEQQSMADRHCFAAQANIEELVAERKNLVERRKFLAKIKTTGVKKVLATLRAQRVALKSIRNERSRLEKEKTIKEVIKAVKSCRFVFKSEGAYNKEVAALKSRISEVNRQLDEQENLRRIQVGEESARHLVHPFLLVQDYIARVTDNTDWLDAMHGRSPGSYSAMVVDYDGETPDAQTVIENLFFESWMGVSSEGSLFKGLFDLFPGNRLQGGDAYPFRGSILDLCSIKTGENAFGAAIHATSAYAKGFAAMQKCWERYENSEAGDHENRENLLRNAKESSRTYKKRLKTALLEAARLITDNEFSLLGAGEKGEEGGVIYGVNLLA